MFSLPQEMNSKILSNLNPHEIIKIESINISMSKLCQDENFWEQYVKNKYDPNYYVDINDGAFENNGYDSPWDNLLERSNIVIRPNEKELWKILAIWIDKAKVIRSLCLEDLVPGKQIVTSNIQSLISQYDKIKNFVDICTFMYGNDVSVIYKNGNYIIKSLNKKFETENFPKIDANTLLRDINIRGRNLVDHITTEAFW